MIPLIVKFLSISITFYLSIFFKVFFNLSIVSIGDLTYKSLNSWLIFGIQVRKYKKSDGRPPRCSQRESCLVIILFLTFFVQRISRKRLDRFSWNFHTWYLMIKRYYTFFCFDDVTSGFEISTILWFLIGHFVCLVSPKWVKRDIWNFHGW